MSNRAQNEGDGPDGPIRSIVIVGGGTAGWMSAAFLANKLRHLPITITVVDSAQIGTIGVGEATVPAIRDFLSAVALGEMDVLRETEGTVKLGIRFADWAEVGHDFFHPFGLYGVPARGVAFHHYWLKLRAAGDALPLADYCLCTQLAEQGLFLSPPDRPTSDLGIFNFALHFDASRFAAMLRRLSLANKVRHIDGLIERVEQHPERGDVTAVVLAGGARVEGDLWIDCSGFRGLLIAGAQDVPFVDWRHWLPCDRAVAIGCAEAQPHKPVTTATAREAGWQWHIPLRHRIGNGYVYSSDHLGDDDAEAALRDRLEGSPVTEANRLRFTAGHRAETWRRNVVAIGLSGGFLEPLESTSITLIQSGLERLVQLFPERGCDPRLAATYNRQSTLEFERIRDFLLLHYVGNRRYGEPFWDRMRALDLPESLQAKLDAWRAQGAFVRYEWETFQDPSWLSLYAGFGDLPGRYNLLADQFSTEELRDTFARMRQAIAGTVKLGVPHRSIVD
ncbi:tryptophan halogenase family protein [Allosphingosinicella deserti]|uniref:Tryptophan halogenase n=1 Tax=Allosphingosinicella deserti TaxID=2116704 RepID=A0A2P7QGH1_9SPHN|nr:tryptophan halogenase family protein [Sphingomonas deserti]PSJ37067.1 tryptophan halogenase [Sphingomonas deserti]